MRMLTESEISQVSGGNAIPGNGGDQSNNPKCIEVSRDVFESLINLGMDGAAPADPSNGKQSGWDTLTQVLDSVQFGYNVSQLDLYCQDYPDTQPITIGLDQTDNGNDQVSYIDLSGDTVQLEGDVTECGDGSWYADGDWGDYQDEES